MRLVQPLGQLPTAQVFFHQSLIELANDFGFFRINNDLRRTAMPFGQILIAVTMIRPRYKLPSARFLQPSTSGAFENLGAFVLCPHPLPLRQQFSLGGITKGMLQKNPVDAEFLKLFDQ